MKTEKKMAKVENKSYSKIVSAGYGVEITSQKGGRAYLYLTKKDGEEVKRQARLEFMSNNTTSAYLTKRAPYALKDGHLGSALQFAAEIITASTGDKK